MRDKLKGILIAVVAIAGLAVGGAAIAGAAGGDDGSGKPITGSALDRASAIALKAVGGGKVSGTEAGDEEGYYQVEVTRPDGTHVDVNLDRSFHVVKQKVDKEDGR